MEPTAAWCVDTNSGVISRTMCCITDFEVEVEAQEVKNTLFTLLASSLAGWRHIISKNNDNVDNANVKFTLSLLEQLKS